MLINGYEINGEIVINGPEIVLSSLVGEGQLVSIVQSVGLTGEGLLLSLRQTVTSLQTGSGLLVSFEQDVKAINSGQIVAITQLVVEPSINSFYQRNGWYPIITINSLTWSEENISDVISVSRNENDAAQATLTLLLRKNSPYGVINFEAFDGQPITIDIFENARIRRIFTGRVNIPTVDLIRGSITLSCIDDRQEKINNTYHGIMQSIGYYDEDIMGTVNSPFDELEKRLATTPQVVDLDTYGNIIAANSLPAATPTFTLNDADVYRDDGRDPTVEKLIRSRIVNKVDINISYQYPRLYHKEIQYTWTWATDRCSFLLDGYSLAQRSMIESAARSTGWPLRATPTYTEAPPNGTYNCSGQTVLFSTIRTSASTVAQKDAEGNPITDSNGNQIYKAQNASFEDSRGTTAIGAGWRATFRWAQNIVENYTLSVTAPQSIARYGTVDQNQSMGIDNDVDVSDWENYDTYKTAPSNTVPAQPSVNYYLNRDTKRATFNKAVAIGLSTAQTMILSSHRDNRVTFHCPFKPDFETSHTIKLDCTRIVAQGKVFQLDHMLNVETGEAYTRSTIALSRSTGSASNSPFSIPTAPAYSPTIASPGITLGSIYGEEPNENTVGFVGNRWKTVDDYTFGFRGSNTFKTTVQEQFIVKTPEIPENLRNNAVLQATASYTVEIPNNPLVVSLL